MEKVLDSLLYMMGEMSPYILLGLLIAGLLNSFVPSQTMSRHLSSSGWRSVVKAALFGIPLPLCSCGVLPTAVALRRSGASKAATSSFLISTPQTGVDSIAATWSLLGPAFAIMRPVAALTTAVFGGFAVGQSEKDERQDSDCVSACQIDNNGEDRRGFMSKLLSALRYGFFDMVQSIGGWLVGGLIIAALITVLVPADYFSALGQHPIVAMLAVVAVAVPMYVCATGSIPIALSLMLKGLSPGTAFVLLMAGPAANFASVAILTKTIGRKSAIIYLSSIVLGAIFFGLAIDYFMPRSWFPMPASSASEACHHSLPVFSIVCSAILVILLIIAFSAQLLNRKHNTNKSSVMTKEYKITGMNCPHCQKSVERAIASVAGVESVIVDLHKGKATVEGTPDTQTLIKAVEAAGFDASEL